MIEITNRINSVLSTDQMQKDRRAVSDPPRVDRMSASGRCYRERWFTFRGFEMDPGKGFSHNPKLLRVFRLGHAIEDEVVALLELAGFEVKDQQLELGSGEWLGHIDGLIDMGRGGIPDWCLLEVKSAKASRFDLLCELDSYEAWSPNYGAQIHAYLHHLPPSITDAVVIVYNKDTSEIYEERILFDYEQAKTLKRENDLVTAPSKMPPIRPSVAKSQYCAFCKWCDFNQSCWGGAVDVEFDE